MNNADLGLTIQKYICDYFNVPIPIEAKQQFTSSYNESYVKETNLKDIVKLAFDELGIIPKECLTYTKSHNAGESLSPHNFILMNEKTLSIRTSKSSDKIAPRVVGQAGLDTFNYYFDQFIDYKVENKEQIKDVVIKNIHKMLPIFFEYLFISDYTIWIQYSNDNKLSYTIFDRNQCLDLEFDRNNFTFTRLPPQWTESTTLKYKGKSIAEIQIHKNRTFKFRFIMSAVIDFLRTINSTTETLGISAEREICNIYNLPCPNHINNRSSKILEDQLNPILRKAFLLLPNPVQYTGSDAGTRLAESKCPYDFLLDGNLTLSLKTNTGKMVCPPEVGQPSAKTCYLYFGNLCDENEINELSFKRMVYRNISEMLHIYAQHLFDSDYLLWIYKENDVFNYKVFNKDYASNFIWDKSKISFTKEHIEDWNESNTVKYNDLSIGEFQVHKNRNSYKFRFNLNNLIKLIEGGI